MKLALTMAFLGSQSSSLAFNLPATVSSLTARYSTSTSTSTSRLFASTYDIDPDESSEQRLADAVGAGTGNGSASSSSSEQVLSSSPPMSTSASASASASASGPTRFDSLLADVGLEGQLSSMGALRDKRVISGNDVFCNRELQLGSVRAIGFDMDYTIAQYKQPAFDKLAFDGAKEKLVNELGYPEEFLNIEYDHEFWVRGLIIDTQRGNFIKIDRHKYVRVAYHGYTPISSRTRKDLYSRFFNQVPSFGEKQYVDMDTLFQFVDASLFASMIEMKDNGEHEFMDYKTYEELYNDMRHSVDLCHRDGVIKDEVAKNPEKYIVLDDEMVPMLKQYKEDGIKVFLLTNSLWEYASVAMNYLYHQADVDEDLKLKNEWTDLFDLVVVGSCKPAYMRDPYLNLFRVNMEDGSLLNTDGLYEIDALGDNGAQKFLNQGKVFQGGNWKHLTAMLEVDAGEEILYVGDHLYSDVLRSKRTLGWRSAFIMPELPGEMKNFYEQIPVRNKINKLRSLRDELSVAGDAIRISGDADADEKLRLLEEDDDKIKMVLTDLAEKYHRSFHPIWGMMFQAGYQDSRLAYFVTNYACLYTAKATNLGSVSTNRAFRTAADVLPHDELISCDSTRFEEE
eukprot:CAMPEP_0194081096 /NCGR_PEP_ID=MMETSP0149-20130528/6985_1 /TAXON_ID=122233 /ORGANISM="Chaetoceros debilis, Strain MM31A-1" /LENGTH=623 /DNA_ID=CAMNT_0038762959 /DNA_START=91 /DNA_END=1962 /DNA_ORIENTATION=-